MELSLPHDLWPPRSNWPLRKIKFQTLLTPEPFPISTSFFQRGQVWLRCKIKSVNGYNSFTKSNLTLEVILECLNGTKLWNIYKNLFCNFLLQNCSTFWNIYLWPLRSILTMEAITLLNVLKLLLLNKIELCP